MRITMLAGSILCWGLLVLTGSPWFLMPQIACMAGFALTLTEGD